MMTESISRAWRADRASAVRIESADTWAPPPGYVSTEALLPVTWTRCPRFEGGRPYNLTGGPGNRGGAHVSAPTEQTRPSLDR